jgi:hypothetical protein
MQALFSQGCRLVLLLVISVIGFVLALWESVPLAFLFWEVVPFLGFRPCWLFGLYFPMLC